MGACQSELPKDPNQQQDFNIDEPRLDSEQAAYIVLANWRNDQCDGSNQPNSIQFGKSNREYQNIHENMQQNQSKIAQTQGQYSQRVSVFSGYSRIEQSRGVQKEQDIQRRPINLTRRNIW